MKTKYKYVFITLKKERKKKMNEERKNKYAFIVLKKERKKRKV